MVRIGSNRIVIKCKEAVIKLPIGKRGIIANYIEYRNYLEHPDIVAKTSYHWYGLKQEKLHNLHTFPHTLKCEDLAEDIRPLYKYRTFSRMQVGQTTTNEWKYFDYEDSKWIFYTKEFKERVLKQQNKI